jgi:hypothetical protein
MTQSRRTVLSHEHHRCALSRCRSVTDVSGIYGESVVTPGKIMPTAVGMAIAINPTGQFAD